MTLSDAGVADRHFAIPKRLAVNCESRSDELLVSPLHQNVAARRICNKSTCKATTIAAKAACLGALLQSGVGSQADSDEHIIERERSFAWTTMSISKVSRIALAALSLVRM